MCFDNPSRHSKNFISELLRKLCFIRYHSLKTSTEYKKLRAFGFPGITLHWTYSWIVASTLPWHSRHENIDDLHSKRPSEVTTITTRDPHSICTAGEPQKVHWWGLKQGTGTSETINNNLKAIRWENVVVPFSTSFPVESTNSIIFKEYQLSLETNHRWWNGCWAWKEKSQSPQ